MSSVSLRTIASASMCALLLAACGGGGSGGTGGGISAEGAYSGTLTGGTSTQFQLLVLENDEYWALYGVPSGSQFLVRGFIQGQGSSANPNFTSSNAKDFGASPAASGSITATYSAGQSITGTATGAGGTSSFSGTPIATSSYDYSAAASLPAIAGNWTMMSLTGTVVTLNIGSNGNFTANASGCAISGTVTPRPSGKNVFNVSLTFGSAPCALPGLSGTGIAVTYITTTGTRQLIMAGVDASRQNGTALFGIR
jgi:hypothetical protein